MIIQLLGAHDGQGAGAAPPVSAGPAPAGFEAVVAKALPSVVQIRSSRGLGSGVVFDDAGHVVTNAHVVAGFRSFTVTLADGSQHTAKLRGAFPQGDLAVIQLDGARPSPATFSDSSRVRVGEYALAIGNPLGLRSSVTQGVVSSTGRTVPEGSGIVLPSVIQTSAPINPGNSGGALIDATGAVIGIPTLAASDPQMGGRRDRLCHLEQYGSVDRRPARRTGSVSHSGRAWLGVDLRTLPGVGVVVASTTANGPAVRAGVRTGDIIVSVGGHPSPSVDDLALKLATEQPGRRIALELRGSGGTRLAEVTLGELP